MSLLKLTITKLVSKCAQGMNEQLLKTLGADVLSSREKHRNTLGVRHPLSIVSVLSLNPNLFARLQVN